MSREYETYRDRLLYNREKAAKLFPGVEELNITQAAKVVGIDRKTMHRRQVEYGFYKGRTTVEKITRTQSMEMPRRNERGA